MSTNNGILLRADETGETSAEEKRAKEVQDAIEAADKKKCADADEQSGKLDKLLMGLELLCKRMDAIESDAKARKDGEGDATENEKIAQASAEKIAADSKLTPDQRRRAYEAALTDSQARADGVAQAFGESAPPPMSGETVRAYRVRLLKRFQNHSAQFKDVDLGASVEPALFDAIEARIYSDSMAASAHPVAPEGRLICRERQVGGHTYREFHGSPSAWMNDLAGPTRQFVTKFNDDSFRSRRAN